MHFIIILIVTLVGGSGPHEGNIFVGGQPVCDDGSEEHLMSNARVVCRFIHIVDDAVQESNNPLFHNISF